MLRFSFSFFLPPLTAARIKKGVHRIRWRISENPIVPAIGGSLAYGGIYGNDMDTPRGNDQTLGYFAGGAVKTAYNWRFAKDWSLQPNFLVAYNFFGKELFL